MTISNKRRKKKQTNLKKLKTQNENAAGIDIGSTSHFVAVPEDRAEKSTREFGCLTPDLHEMAKWLKECKIETIVIESTGVYWIPVVNILEKYKFEVFLVDAHNLKNVSGKKTDVSDAEWLMQLHTYGLLAPAFRPSAEMRPLRDYWRHRDSLVHDAARQIQKMQKALEQMNLQLHKVISDITGETGFKIIRAIVSGERDPATLAQMRNGRIKSSEETIQKSLTGDYHEEQVFMLKQAIDTYDYLKKQILECDKAIENYMQKIENKISGADLEKKKINKTKKRKSKNAPAFDLKEELIRIAGVDLTQINGIDVMTAQTIITECDIDMSKFRTEKHFASWLGLCPNNRITGGKVKSRRTRKVQNRAARALRIAAQSTAKSDSAIGGFFRRMRAKNGTPSAVTATAHKLAKQVYRMLKYGQDFVDIGLEEYQKQYRERKIKYLIKQIDNLGFELIEKKTGEVVP